MGIVDVESLKEEYAKCPEFNKIYAELKEHGSSHQYPDFALRAEDDLLFFCDGHRLDSAYRQVTAAIYYQFYMTTLWADISIQRR